MIRSMEHMKKFEIVATDGRIGAVDDFYFDDERWAIRGYPYYWGHAGPVGRTRRSRAADPGADGFPARDRVRSGTEGRRTGRHPPGKRTITSTSNSLGIGIPKKIPVRAKRRSRTCETTQTGMRHR
jgi:hypothetical protein